MNQTDKLRFLEQVKNAVKPHPLYGGMPVKIDGLQQNKDQEIDQYGKIKFPKQKQITMALRSPYGVSDQNLNIQYLGEMQYFNKIR